MIGTNFMKNRFLAHCYMLWTTTCGTLSRIWHKRYLKKYRNENKHRKNLVPEISTGTGKNSGTVILWHWDTLRHSETHWDTGTSFVPYFLAPPCTASCLPLSISTAPSSSSSSLSSCEIATFYNKESQMSPSLTFTINLSLCALFLIPSTLLSLPSRQIISTSPACDSPIQWVFDKQIFSSFPCDCFCQVFAQSSSCPPSQNKSQKFSQRPLWRIFIKPHSTMPTCNWDTASIVSDEDLEDLNFHRVLRSVLLH